MDHKYRILKTLVEMCTDRGYLCVENDIIRLLNDKKYQQIAKIMDDQDLLFEATGHNTRTMVYRTTEKLGKHHIDGYTSDITPGVQIILVYTEMTSPGKDAISRYPFVCVFHESELLVNITHHKIYMAHTLLNGEETDKLKKTYSACTFPVILASDPVCKYFNWKNPSIIKIERRWGSHEQTYYRMVV